MRWLRSRSRPLGLALFASFALLAAAGVSSVACDSPPDAKPLSTFSDPAPNATEIGGHVHIGTEAAVGALVRVDPSPESSVDPLLLAAADRDPKFARTTTTDAAGLYRVQFNPFVYDLSIAHGVDAYVFHDLELRAFDPPLVVSEGAAPIVGFKARIVPTTNPPPAAGNAVVYFVSGAEARTITPAAGGAGAFDTVFRHFESTITLHAIEYVANRGPGSAVAEGKVDVRVRDGVVSTPALAMTPITAIAAATFDVTPPPGYVLASIALEMDLGLRTSAVPLPLTQVPRDTILNFAVATDARYFVRARATKGGAVSDSGRFLVNPFDKNVLVLPPPVSAEAPIDDEAITMAGAMDGAMDGATDGGTTKNPPTVLARGGALSVRLVKGIVEHALVPENGVGTTFHVVTGRRATTLPDASALGLAAPSGRYRWTVRSFPTLTFTDRLGGEEGRIVPPSWTSAPHVLSLAQ